MLTGKSEMISFVTVGGRTSAVVLAVQGPPVNNGTKKAKSTSSGGKASKTTSGKHKKQAESNSKRDLPDASIKTRSKMTNSKNVIIKPGSILSDEYPPPPGGVVLLLASSRSGWRGTKSTDKKRKALNDDCNDSRTSTRREGMESINTDCGDAISGSLRRLRPRRSFSSSYQLNA
jgi:hypothetical protein